MRVNGFHHLALQAHDTEALAAFYRDVLGLTEQAVHRREDGSVRAVWLSLGEGFLAVEAVEGQPLGAGPGGADRAFKNDRPGYHLLSLRISRDDRAAILAELARAGVAVEHQSRWTVYFRDPEGNRVGLSHHPVDPAP